MTGIPKTLSPLQLSIARLLVWAYYGRIAVIGTPNLSAPTLYLCSHKNGATDGLVMATALNAVPSLVSVQLHRNPLFRLLFDGIAVVRKKDVARYGIDKSSVLSPVLASVQQLASGGSLCLYPEGTSEFSYKPKPYQHGMAKIINTLKENGQTVQAQAVGLFYTKPDGVGSRVSIVFGEPFFPSAVGENGLYDELSGALNAVSVNCKNANEFNIIQNHAWQACQTGADFGQAFLALQQNTSDTNAHTKFAKAQNHSTIKNSLQKYLAQALLCLGFLPIMGLGFVVGRLADARNTVTFFRLLGVMAGTLVQGVLWLILCVVWTKGALIWLVLMGFGLVGRWCYPEPSPVDLKINCQNSA